MGKLQFTDRDWCILLQSSLDLDSNFLSLAFNQCEQLGATTEALTLLFSMGDSKLSNAAMVYFIKRNGLIDMLIESQSKSTYKFLDFEMNKAVSLRRFIGDSRFIELVKCAVELIGGKGDSDENDQVTCICLLDKIKLTEEALRRLTDL